MEVGARGVAVVNVCPGPVRSEITLHAYCATPGKPFGAPTEDAVFRLTAERCARLMATAIHFRLPEAWVSPQPILAYMYLAQFLPGLYLALSPTFGKRRVDAFRRGQMGYDSVQNPVSILGSYFGLGGGDALAPVRLPGAGLARFGAVAGGLAARADAAARARGGARGAREHGAAGCLKFPGTVLGV